MHDVAIVGSGLSGLALATKLYRRGHDIVVLEARDRLGGRILTVPGPNGSGFDLGPTWHWPKTQPLVAQLVKELGLVDFAQYDEGAVLHLREGDKKAERIEGQSLYEDARRIHGGAGALIAGLAKQLPSSSISLQTEVKALRDCGDHIAVTVIAGGETKEIAAKHVVLSLPPRLAREMIQFTPALDEPTTHALQGAETWMAAQAKVVIEYSSPFWRGENLSGAAFVTHEQATIGEIFDSCDISAQLFALGGFIALSPELRESFKVGLPMLFYSQINAVFGRDIEHGAIHYQDWAAEKYTCSAADREFREDDKTHDAANPMLRQSLWDKKLYFGGSETAARSAGYLEGALDAARRVERALSAIDTKRRMSRAEDDDPYKDYPLNEASLARFAAWVDSRSDVVFENYRRRLNRALASQQRENLTQISILGAMEDIFQEALTEVNRLPFDMAAVSVEKGRASLTPAIQQPFGDLMQAIIDDVVAFNRTSCALSNFPGEHHLSKDYLQVIMQDIAAAWREFSLSANRMLLEKKNAQFTQEKTE